VVWARDDRTFGRIAGDGDGFESVSSRPEYDVEKYIYNLCVLLFHTSNYILNGVPTPLSRHSKRIATFTENCSDVVPASDPRIHASGPVLPV
jgi:hypothetical protein